MIELLTSTEVLVGLALAFGGTIVAFLSSTFITGATARAEIALTADLRGDMRLGFDQVGKRLDSVVDGMRNMRDDSLAVRQQSMQTQQAVENLRRDTREDVNGIRVTVKEHESRISNLEAK